MEEDKSSRVNEKNWRCICDRLKMGACPSLESIYLPGNCIGTAGVEALMEVYHDGHIKHCTALDLTGNSIGDKGAIALANLFNIPDLCTNMTTLKLSNNKIRSKGWDAFLARFAAESHSSLHTLDISCITNQ